MAVPQSADRMHHSKNKCVFNLVDTCLYSRNNTKISAIHVEVIRVLVLTDG